jgi:hypothetical protein
LAVSLFGQAPPEQSLDAVKEFRRWFKEYPEIANKVEAIHTLKGNECEPACIELVQLLDHKVEEIRLAARAVLNQYTQDATWTSTLAGLPALKNSARRAGVIEIVGEAGVASALPALVELGRVDKSLDADARLALARAFGRIGDDNAADLLRGFLRDGDARVRAASADAVGLRFKALGPDLLPLLDDQAWQVQAAAITALGKVRLESAVMPLIGVMRRGGRLREDAADALFSITMKDYGTDPETWEKQMKRLFDLGWRAPTDEEVAKARANRKKSAEYYGMRDGAPTTFAGISTTSKQVLFIIDVSGSMADNVVETEKFKGGDYEDMSKLAIAKAELIRTIDGLGPDTFFNIVAFATDLKTWKDYPAPANITNRSSAKAWVRGRKAIGGGDAQELAAVGFSNDLTAGKTNTFKALMFPFGVDPDRPQAGAAEKALVKGKLDTVFFLSDGRPSTGKLVDTTEILKAITDLNQTHKLVIHTIAIGEFEKSFLEGLAQLTNGVFVDLGR